MLRKDSNISKELLVLRPVLDLLKAELEIVEGNEEAVADIQFLMDYSDDLEITSFEGGAVFMRIVKMDWVRIREIALTVGLIIDGTVDGTVVSDVPTLVHLKQKIKVRKKI